MKNIKYKVIFRSEAEGGYTVIVPSLPGCVSYGKNKKEAKAMAADAIEGYIISLKKHNEPIPSDDNCFITSINVKNALHGSRLKYAKT